MDDSRHLLSQQQQQQQQQHDDDLTESSTSSLSATAFYSAAGDYNVNVNVNGVANAKPLLHFRAEGDGGQKLPAAITSTRSTASTGKVKPASIYCSSLNRLKLNSPLQSDSPNTALYQNILGEEDEEPRRLLLEMECADQVGGKPRTEYQDRLFSALFLLAVAVMYALGLFYLFSTQQASVKLISHFPMKFSFRRNNWTAIC
jgi:hypothetical protein